MGKRYASEPEYALAIHESSTSIGAGNRRRELRYWEAVWNIPDEYHHLVKTRQIVGSSKSSKAEAIAQAEELITQFLQEHSLR